MLTSYFIALLLINIISSNPFQRNRCDVCNLTEDFIPSNGYQCFITNDYKVLCTCPDNLQSTINRPCRICDRENICGQSDALCSEDPTFFGINNNNSHFICFCSSGKYEFDKKCSEETNPTTNQIKETTILSISTTSLIEETITNQITTNIYIDETTSNSISTDYSIEETSTHIQTTTNIPIISTNSQQETTTQPETTIQPEDTTQSETICGCRSTSSHLFLKIDFIILLNLVYFLNK
ncbi:unnamed protein product [Rotaria sp. Silwood1]|nr:unnamed protein product [Rotaria sp. Silwood1]CAF1641476.1 unnamed protein product [Rotaria sp. Silwood1]CAF3951942.1 unnamed protein product [Rotaria sp. Silwood1]CAF5043107.1 unnamed protein product [Rotaria sp. Silwood1]